MRQGYTAAHARAEESSEYSFGDCETAVISADERCEEIWNDPELLSEAICGAWGDSVLSVRGERHWTSFPKNEPRHSPAVTSGEEAIALLQRAYNAGTDAERQAIIAEFGRTVYHSLIDYVQEQAAQS